MFTILSGHISVPTRAVTKSDFHYINIEAVQIHGNNIITISLKNDHKNQIEL